MGVEKVMRSSKFISKGYRPAAFQQTGYEAFMKIVENNNLENKIKAQHLC